MFRAGTENPWFWSAYLDLGISFCVWILAIDGLHIPPFDHHPVGRGFLQRAGLEAESWRSWFHEVVTSRTNFNLQTRRDTDIRELASGLEAIRDPTTAWTGAGVVREHLSALWHQYEAGIGEKWRERNAKAHLPPKEKPGEMRKLWNDLKPFHSRLQTLQIVFVEYPWIVSYAIPPVTLVLGDGNESVDGGTFSSLVLRGAEELARYSTE